MALHPTKTLLERQLVERLQSGDEAALSLLYDHYAANLHGAIRRIIRCDQTAEDVLQECFLKVWASINGYDAAKGSLFTWLLRIARNKAIDAARAPHYRWSLCSSGVKAAKHDPRNVCHSLKPEHVDVGGLARCLSPEHRIVVELLYFGGCTQAEAARELGIPLGTVKTRARNAIRALRMVYKAPPR
ncbi:RNA polymerase sigma factor [Pontibacter akesuensis]|uniref:RNA polymerase sigma-70 factor, ECF subfamily n=1 Tax=Pontibacter akesuensis TaxID=388950 RepID=A0A1I7JXN4_9BACT|nr:sigma factor [Pontibacter akesuensis]GHA76737.1 DNA-directed RNA polymerase sigma-70 factor [Pontibacter akesuensis]SFU89957.1 RNA polymerase sigma-70 factor, ECF subfamily [Pontibacter akesuensis]